MRRLPALLALLAIAALPAAAAAKPAPSANVERVASVPAPAGIGANFKKVDGRQYMFVTGSAGLYVYDTTDAASPAPVATLPLPHYQNEDVSIGGKYLLLSGDGLAGGGVLFIIDISNPSAPRLAHTVKMYTLGGPGHTATCIQECKYVWAAGYGTIYVLDLTKLADAPAPVTGLTGSTNHGIEVGDMVTHHEFGWSTHDVQVDGAGMAWVAGGNGTIGFDTRPTAYPNMSKDDPSTPQVEPAALLDPKVVARTGPNATADSDFNTIPGSNGRGDTVNDFIHHNSQRVDGDLILIGEEDIWNRDTFSTPAGCESQGSFQTWRITKFGATGPETGTVQNLDTWTTEFNEAIANDENPVTGNDVVPTNGMCSAHYFDAKRGISATAWYQQGIRFLDYSDPRNIQQTAYYLPEGTAMWASYWAPNAKNIVYAVDNARSVVDVLRYERKKAAASGDVTAPIPRHWFDGKSDAVAHAKYGWVCRLGA